MQMIQRSMEERQLGIFGEKRVNVLMLNLALAKQK
ncbi:MAG: potassium-transporting ATPase subunit C [Candidatus Aminicenantes bacterium]|nr:potassium-transporting ATPase subunit C [Candidatus Aminicenantes bacterium]